MIQSSNELRNPLSFITNERHYRHKQVIHTALMNARGILRNIEGKKKNFFIQQKLINLHKSSFHDKFTLGFGVFFFVLGWSCFGSNHQERRLRFTCSIGNFNFSVLSLHWFVWKKMQLRIVVLVLLLEVGPLF